MKWNLLDFLHAHKLVIVALLLGGVGGWFLRGKPPPPKVELSSLEGYEGTSGNDVHILEKQGPVRIVTKKVTMPGPGCTGPEIEETSIEEHGEASKETGEHAEQHVAGVQRLDLKVTPLLLPRYSLYAGTAFYPATRPVLGGALALPELPILGRWWLQGDLTLNFADLPRSELRGFLRKDFF